MFNSRKHLRTIAVASALLFGATALTGCFDKYRVTKDEFSKLQGSDNIPETVKADSGEALQVLEDTNIYVRSTGGRRYQVTPYNFRMTNSQLVASDRDTLLSLGEIDTFEVDVFSKGKTIALISAGVVAVAGLIVAVAVTAGTKSFTDQ